MSVAVLPHSGYHWNHGSGRFFEGWYYRVTLPEVQQSFAFMYSIDDPQGKTPYSGGLVQVLGVEDLSLWRTLPNTKDFRASHDSSNIEHWSKGQQGYSASHIHNKGKICDPVTGRSCIWDYQIQVIDTWGDRRLPIPTMGWLSYLPIFEPGWQILTAHGLATGQIIWDNQIFEFIDAPAYSEKNWGRSFPQKWFWLQCNAFPNYPDLSITAAGGIREILGQKQDVGMIGIHYQGKSYIFLSTQDKLSFHIQPWGLWHMQAQSKNWQVEIIGETQSSGSLVMVPTATGAEFSCRDTAKGQIKLSLKTEQQIKATSNLAALEIGGRDWENPWSFQST